MIITTILIIAIIKVRGSAKLSSFPLPLIADRSADLAKSFGVLQAAQRWEQALLVLILRCWLRPMEENFASLNNLLQGVTSQSQAVAFQQTPSSLLIAKIGLGWDLASDLRKNSTTVDWCAQNIDANCIYAFMGLKFYIVCVGALPLCAGHKGGLCHGRDCSPCGCFSSHWWSVFYISIFIVIISS